MVLLRRRTISLALFALAIVQTWLRFTGNCSNDYSLHMFERYTEKARRVIFYARFEASQFGSPYIETEHLLLGVLREDKALAYRFLQSDTAVDSIRKEIESHTVVREKVSTSVDLPLSNESKRVLAYGAEEAERLSDKHIGSEHLFLGLLREKGCFAAAILTRHGIDADSARRAVSSAERTLVAPPVVPPSSGIGIGSGSAGTRSHLAVFEFTCDGAVIASVTPFVITPVPGVGEQVMLKDKQGADVSYRVEDLTFCYEQFGPDIATAPYQLEKIVIRVKRTDE